MTPDIHRFAAFELDRHGRAYHDRPGAHSARIAGLGGRTWPTVPSGPAACRIARRRVARRPVKVNRLNYIPLGIIVGMLHPNVLLGGKIPAVL
jgi:hypothetical protein